MFVSVFLLKSQLKETNFYHNNFSKCWNIFIQYYSFNFVKVQIQINKSAFLSQEIYISNCDYLILLLQGSFLLFADQALSHSFPTNTWITGRLARFTVTSKWEAEMLVAHCQSSLCFSHLFVLFSFFLPLSFFFDVCSFPSPAFSELRSDCLDLRRTMLHHIFLFFPLTTGLQALWTSV